MSLQKTWIRLISRTNANVKKQVSPYKSFLHKIAAGVAGLSFLATGNFALGSTITAHGGATTVTSSGNRFKVETTQKSGSNAFNSFSAFNLSSGDIVNMHLPAATNNLINFVSSRITIDGTLNAIKNNKIGGNLFFLSSQGLVVGSGGVVNCGAFYAMTPTKDFMERFVKTDVLLLTGNEAEIGYITSRKFVNHNGVKDGAGVPLATYNPVNEDGSIVINGKISATDNIGLYAGRVALNSGVNAKLTTGVTDFSALVNIADIPGVTVAGLTMTSTSDGNVELVAVADNVGKLATISKLATGFSSFTEASSVAKVTVNGTINAKRNATIEAVAVNGNLNGTQTVVEYGETKEVEQYKNANYLSDIKATVEFGSNARVNADNDIIVNAIARNIYKSSTGNLVDIGLSIAGMTSPVNLAAEVVVADTRAEIKVAQGAVLNAKKDIRIKADSKADVIAGASTAFAKIKQTPGGLSAAAVYAKVNSNADVSINGSLTAGETGDSSKGDVNVSAESVNSLDATGAAKTANDNAILSTGVVVANVNNTSNVQVSNTAVIKAERNAVIKANTVSDVSTVAIVETGDASYAGMAVNVTEFSSDADVNVGCNVDAVAGNVDLSAYNLILQNTSTAKSSVGYTKISQATANLQSNLASAIMTKLSSKFSGTLGAETGSKFSAAGAIVYAQGKHDANVNIAQNVKLTAGDKLVLKSSAKIEDIFFQADSIARSELKKADQTSISVSAGFLYTDIEQNSAVQIADSTANATILTGRTVEINSSTVIEFNRIKRMIQKVKDAVEQLKVSVTDATQLAIINRVSDAYRTMDTQLSAVGAEGLTAGDNLKIVWNALGSLGDVASALSNLVTDEVGVVAQAAKILTSAADFASYNNFLNMSVSSSMSGKTGQTSKDFGFAGAAGINDFVSSSEVIIGRNVTIRSTLPPTVAATTIDISANTNVDTISAAGHIIPSSGAKSFGGTFLLQDFRSSAAVIVAEGARLNAAGNDISVTATNNAGTVVAALSTSNACSGIDGMVTRLTGNSNAVINIDDEVAINAKSLKLGSFNNTKVVNVAGSVMITSAVGVAAGVAINDFTRNSIVFAGDIDKSYQDYLDEKNGVDKATTTDSQATVADAKISALKGVEALAKSTGKILAIGVAGGIAKNDDSGQAGPVDSLVSAYNGAQNSVVNVINSLGSKFNSDCAKQLSGKTSNSGAGSHKNPEFSLSVAGSSGLNFINSATRVDISGATIDLNGAADSNLNVTAVNNSDVMAYAGSVGVMWQSTTQNTAGKSVGIAGAVALNDITNKTEAVIQNSTIVNADKINLYAVNGGSNIAAGLGLQLSNNTSSIAAGAYTMGSSVSINSIANTVTTRLKNTTVTGKDALKTNVNAAAYESDRQITGGVQLSLGKEKGAFGAAVNVANITNNVTAEIDSGTYTKIGNISVSALQALTQVNGALTAGIIWGTPDTVAITGAMIYNRVNNNLNARIKGSANIAAAGTVGVNTRDYRTGNTTSGFEGLLVRSTDSDSFISKDGTDYYNVDASNGVDGAVTPTNIVKNGALIVSGAMAISVADKAAGAAVVINDINNRFVSRIDSSNIAAGSVNTRSEASTFMVSAAGGVAASINNGAGAGSVVWNTVNNDVQAGAVNSVFAAKIVSDQAFNAVKNISVTGQISAGKGPSIGMALTYNDIINRASAFNCSTSLTGPDSADSAILIAAENTSDVLDIAASVAASDKLGVGGSVAINKIKNDTLAVVDRPYKDDSGVTQPGVAFTIAGYKSAQIKATDKSIIKSLAGTVAAGKQGGVGGAVAYNEISGTTGASLNNATVNVNTVLVKADNDSAIWTLAAGIGGAGEVAVQGAAATGEITRTISAEMKNVTVNKTDSSIDITSDSTGGINSSAAVVAVSGEAAVGAGVAVNRISDSVSASVTGGNLTVKDLEIRSKASQTIKTIGAAGSGGGSFGVSGSVAYNKISTTNNAFIKGNAVVTAEDNIGVVAQTDDKLMNYAGVVTIGGTAGIGAAVAVNYIVGDTNAYVDSATVRAKGLSGGITANNGISEASMNSGFISDKSVNVSYNLEQQRTATVNSGIVVDSSATHTLKSFVANAAGAGEVALAGTVNVNQIDGNTRAYINNATVNNGVTAGNVTVNASDYTNSSGFVGSVGGAGAIGIGASSDTNKVNRNTSAKLEGIKTGSLAKAVTVNAIAKQGISSFAAGLGIGGGGGVAGTVSVAMLTGTTEAIVKNSLITLDSLTVNADHWARTHVLDTTAAVGGYAGIGGAVAVNDIRDVVKAEVTNSTVNVNTNGVGAILVKAANYSLLNATAAALGGGALGLAGNVSLNYMDNQVTASVYNSSLGSLAKRAGSINVRSQNSSNILSNIGTVAAGMAGAGASVGVNTLDGQVRTVVDGSNLYAKDNIDIIADESRGVNQKTFTAAVGGVGVAGNVMIVSSGRMLSTSGDDGNREIANAVSAAERVNSGSIGATNGALTVAERSALNGTSNKLSAQAAGKSATTVAVGKIASANSSALNSSAGAVKILATENTNATLTGGTAAVGGAAAGGSVGIVDVNRNVGTTLLNATINAAGNIDVNSEVKGNTTLNMYQGSLGIFAAGSAAYGRIGTTGNALTAVSNSSLTNSGNIAIGAKDNSGAKAESYGLTAGTIAAGALITRIDNDSIANIALNQSTLNSANKIDVKAEKENSLTARSVGGALGLVAAGTGITSTVNESGKSKVIMTGSGSNFNGTEVAFDAVNKPVVVSEATSAAISGLVSAGVSLANSTLAGQSVVNVAGGNIFSAPLVNFRGTFAGRNNVLAVGLSGGFAGSFGYNQSNADNNALVNVLIANNTYADSTSLKLAGSNVVNQEAETKGLSVGGLIASGNNKARTASNQTTAVDLTGDPDTARRLRSIDVDADSSSIHTVKANGNGGGLISADGLSAYAINNMQSNTTARLGGKWIVTDNGSGPAVRVTAAQHDKVRMSADSVKGSAVGYSGTKAESVIKATTRAEVAAGTQVNSASDIRIEAKNFFDLAGVGEYTADGSGYGGIVVNGATSNLNIDSSTVEVKIGENAQLISAGAIIGNAYTDARITNKARTSGAGMVANPLAYSNSNLRFINTLTTGTGSLLQTTSAGKNISLAASGKVDGTLTAESDMQGGLGGGSKAETSAAITKNNSVTLNGALYSMNDVNLNTDADAYGISSMYQLKALADAYNKHSAVAIAHASLNSSTIQNNTINIESAALVKSVRHINLNSTSGREEMLEAASEYTWYHSDDPNAISNFSSTAMGRRSRNLSGKNSVKVNGTLVAGVQNKVNVTLNGTVDPTGQAGSGFSTAPTITSTVDAYKTGITYGVTDYGRDLFDRYLEVSRLAGEYAGSIAGTGYEAEKVRLLNEMAKYNLYYKDNDGTEHIISGKTPVSYVELPDMVSSGGNIVINTDKTGGVSGTGLIKAQGAPEINITNNTNLYLKVKDLSIANYGGEIIHNSASLGDTATSKLGVNSSTDPAKSASINVKQMWKGVLAVPYNDGVNTVVRTITPITAVEINGHISNPLGTINIYNRSGDIVLQGKTSDDSASINGATISLTADTGSISQGYSKGITNIGGTPEDVYYNDTHLYQVYTGDVNWDAKESGSLDLTLQHKTWIAGGNVYLNADDINVNGTIQSGYEKYTLELSDTAQALINGWNRDYNNENISQGELQQRYKLNNGGSKLKDGKYYYEVQAWYNPQTKQILLEDVEPQGGKIYLTGRISSTGSGKIVAADGPSDIQVNNLTSSEITLGNVNVGDIEGVISIADTARGKVSEFRRDSTTTYDIGKSEKTVSSASSVYNPLSGLSYNWSKGHLRTRRRERKLEEGFKWWGGWKSGSDSAEYSTQGYETFSVSSGKIPGTYIGVLDGSKGPVGDYSCFTKQVIDYKNDYYNRWTSYSNWTHFSGTNHYEWKYESGISLTYLHALKADRPIGIAWIGSNVGKIDVSSKNTINLTGNLTGIPATAIRIASNEGAIKQTGGSIIGDNVSLTAKTGIGVNGAVHHRVLGDNGSLTARTDSGNIDIISMKSIGKAGNIGLTAIANSGNVSISADGSIYQSGTGLAVKGERIDLVSNYGTIGSLSAPGASNGSLLIQGGQTPRVSGDTMSASVNARAHGGIYLKQDSGDMRLGHVESVTGDVTLRVNTGDFYDALPVGEAIKGNSADELIAKWTKLGIINADGSDNAASKKIVAVRNYEDGVKGQFASYQSQKKVYDKNPGLNRAASYLALHARFSGHASAEAYLAAMSADRNSDFYKLSSNTYGWTRDNLLYALQSSIINKTGGSSQTTVKGVNVKGKNITLSAGHGIGRDEGKEEVDLTRLNETATLKKLAAAEASDIKWGVDKYGNENKQIATVNKTNAIGIEMREGGLLTADAQQNIYIAGATDDPIYLNNVSGQNIRLLGKNGIYNVSVQENDGNSNINGIDLILEGGSSQIGTVDKPVYINTLGKVTARADGLINIYHKNGSNPLQISAIYGGANVMLRALNGILSVNTGIPSEDLGYINAAGVLSLQSFKGNIGEATKGLRILADNTNAVNALASNIYIAAESQSSAKPPLNIGNIDVGNGTFKVTSDRTGVNFTGSVSARDVFIKTDSVSQTGDNAYIHADNLYAETRNGMSLNSTQNKVPVVAFSGTGSGNIAFTGSVPDLQLNGISNINGDVSINNQRGNVNIIESINARNLFISAAQGLLSQTNSCEITAANLNAVTLNGMSLAGFISRATLSNSGSGNIRLLNFSDLVLESVTNRVSGGNVDIICRNIDQKVNSISRGSIESAGEVNITCDNTVNVTSIKSANNLNINCFGGITSDHLESLNGNVNLIANGSGDINVHELLGRKVQALMQGGNVLLGYLKAYSAVLGSKSRDGLIRVDKAEVSGNIDARAARVSIDSIAHKSDANKLQLTFSGANNGCMDSVFIDNIYSDTGVQVNGLWTNTADIQTNHSDFTLSDVYVVDRGYLSNGNVSMTVFGQNPVQDNSHIQIHFAPKEAGNFTDISFLSIFGGFDTDDYTIIHFADEVSWLFNQLSWVDEVSFTVNSTLKAVSLGGRPLKQPDQELFDNEFAYKAGDIVNLTSMAIWANNISIRNDSIVNVDTSATEDDASRITTADDSAAGSETEADD